jgi:hypothetical protein
VLNTGIGPRHKTQRESKPVFFCHIPKTGGHAIKKAAKLVLGDEYVCSTEDLAGLRNAYESGNLLNKKFIIGHLSVREVLTVFRRSEVHLATFVRNPAERLVSQYYQIQSHQSRWLFTHKQQVLRKVKNQSLRDYVLSRDPNVETIRSNVISKFFLGTRDGLPPLREPSPLNFVSFSGGCPVLDEQQLLAAADRFDFIGFTEDFNLSLSCLLSKFFPDRAVDFETNSVGFINTRYQKEDFDPEVFTLIPKISERIDETLCEEIRANVALDSRLYNFVAERAGRSDLSCNGLPPCAAALSLDTSPEFSKRVAHTLEHRIRLAEQALAVSRSALPLTSPRWRFAPEGYSKLLRGAWKVIQTQRRQAIPLRKIILPRLRRRLGW